MYKVSQPQKNKLNLYYNNDIIGYIVITISKNSEIIINTIYIYEKHRKCGHLKSIWPLLEIELFKSNGNVTIWLIAKELYEYYGKLVRLYESLGFSVDINKEEKCKYVGEYMYRYVYMRKEPN